MWIPPPPIVRRSSRHISLVEGDCLLTRSWLLTQESKVRKRMNRLTANSWLELATARARELECVLSSDVDSIPYDELTVTNCDSFKRVKMNEVLGDKLTIIVLLRHFA